MSAPAANASDHRLARPYSLRSIPRMWQIISTGNGTASRSTRSKEGSSLIPLRQRSTISVIASAISLIRGGVKPLLTILRIRVCCGGSAAAMVLADAISFISTGIPAVRAISRSMTSGVISASAGASPS